MWAQMLALFLIHYGTWLQCSLLKTRLQHKHSGSGTSEKQLDPKGSLPSVDLLMAKFSSLKLIEGSGTC